MGIAGQCKINPWLVVPDQPWCWNADAGLTLLTVPVKMLMLDSLFPGIPAFNYKGIPVYVSTIANFYLVLLAIFRGRLRYFSSPLNTIQLGFFSPVNAIPLVFLMCQSAKRCSAIPPLDMRSTKKTLPEGFFYPLWGRPNRHGRDRDGSIEEGN